MKKLNITKIRALWAKQWKPLEHQDKLKNKQIQTVKKFNITKEN